MLVCRQELDSNCAQSKWIRGINHMSVQPKPGQALCPASAVPESHPLSRGCRKPVPGGSSEAGRA